MSYYGLPRIPWVYSTIIGLLVMFFTSLAGGLNPCFAASIGLLLLWPYNNDYNFHDAGCPPSWNGRQRVRWNDSVGPNACGIFSGHTHIRVGNTGNGIFRLIILMITSWLAWGWRTEFRELLSFGEIQAVSIWVMYVALVIEITIGVLIFVAAIFAYVVLRFRPLSGVVFL